MGTIITWKENSVRNLLLIAVFVLLACWLLFWLDYETKSVSDLFTPGNLAALVLYFVPTYFVTALCYVVFSKSRKRHSLLFSLILGIPAGIAVVICALLLLKN